MFHHHESHEAAMHGVTLVFDLDGTLVDTAPDLIGAANHVLSLRGLSPVAGVKLRPHISFGARKMIMRGLAEHGQTLPDRDIDGMLATFLGYYADNIANESRPFPLLMDTLRHYKQAGATLAVCTNKAEHLARALLAKLDMIDLFAGIAGRDTFPVWKPHPDHLTGVIRLAGGDPARAIMVGDSDVDISTARAASIPCIAVDFGYTDVPVTELNPTVIISHYSEFPAAVTRVLAAA
jgi:phosphoglycolate phosphatase